LIYTVIVTLRCCPPVLLQTAVCTPMPPIGPVSILLCWSRLFLLPPEFFERHGPLSFPFPLPPNHAASGCCRRFPSSIVPKPLLFSTSALSFFLFHRYVPPFAPPQILNRVKPGSPQRASLIFGLFPLLVFSAHAMPRTGSTHLAQLLRSFPIPGPPPSPLGYTKKAGSGRPNSFSFLALGPPPPPPGPHTTRHSAVFGC